jgi:RNA polymerase sigma factor (sigma-70 family)
MNPTDEELLGRAAGRDSGAAEAFFLRHVDGVYGLCLRVIGQAHLAEEAAQETYLRFMRAVPSYRPGEPARPWLMGVAAHAALDARRGEQRLTKREAAVRAEAVQATTEADPAGQAQRAEFAQAAGEAIDRLSADLRLPVLLCCVEGLRQEDVARVLGVSRRAVGLRVKRGLDYLRHQLTSAGLAATPTVLLGALAGMRPVDAPAGLIASVPKLTAAKGHVFAGALAGGAALLASGKSDGKQAAPPAASAPAPAPVPAGKPGWEHWAFVNSAGRIDGPRQEAMGILPVADVDEAGNLYGGGRVVRVDGMVERIWGSDFSYVSPNGLEEGPACCFTASGARNHGWSTQGHLAVRGLPLEGGDKGAIFVPGSSPNVLYKVWKNKDKKDRWWFKRVAGGGAAALPGTGQSAPALSVSLPGYNFFRGHDGNLYVRSGTYPKILRYDDAKGSLTCILSPEDYLNKLDKNRQGSPAGAETVLVGADGTIYLGCALGEGDRPIYRISADRSKFEKVVHGRGLSTGWDGPALKSGYFDGPILVEYSPPDTLFMTSVDDSQLRRYKDGRISTLCGDGEWREFPKKDKCGDWLPMYAYKGKDADSAIIGRRFVLWKNYVYMLYFNGLGSHATIRFGPYDFNKPTVGPLVEGK